MNNWKVSTVIMVLSSVVLYTLIRLLKKYKIPDEIVNIFMFGLAGVIAFASFVSGSDRSNQLNIVQIGLTIIAASLFSFIGSMYSLKALETSPNQALSLVLQKSYSIVTIFAAVLFFNAELKTVYILAAFIVIISSFLIIKPCNDNTKSNRKWIVYTYISFFGFGALTLSSKYLISTLNMPQEAYLFTAFTTVTALNVSKLLIQKTSILGSLNISSTFILIGISITFFVFMQFKSFATVTAPNSGYPDIANLASNGILAFTSWLIFKDKLKLINILGVLGVLGGLSLVVL